MSKKTTTITMIIIVAVLALVTLVFMYRDSLFPKANVNQQTASQNQVDTDSATYKQYAALKGDDYDKAFIDDMIIHHQGAVEMAGLALESTDRQEILDLSRDIIAAQAREITDMERWQQGWGYPTPDHSTMDHSSHGSMGINMNMSDHMDMMMDELKGKTGAEFDKAFLEQMIIHHQGALDMAAPGKDSAKHQEIKDLSIAVVEAQTKEIAQMKQWLASWNFKSN